MKDICSVKNGNVYRENKQNLAAKMGISNIFVVSAQLYGREIWKPIKKVKERMGRFESNRLRKIMKIR